MSSILLVDDEVDILLVLEHVLESAGHQVHTASTATVALSLLNRPHHYDLVLADGKLPDGNGMMVADRAAETGTKALIITGHAGQLPRARSSVAIPISSSPFAHANCSERSTASSMGRRPLRKRNIADALGCARSCDACVGAAALFPIRGSGRVAELKPQKLA